THTHTHTLTHSHIHTHTHTHTQYIFSSHFLLSKMTYIIFSFSLYRLTHTHTQYIFSSHFLLSKMTYIIFSFSLYSLSNCSITEEGFSSLASALRSNPSHMRELQLNGSKAGESGVKHLSSLLEDPNCELEKLE